MHFFSSSSFSLLLLLYLLLLLPSAVSSVLVLRNTNPLSRPDPTGVAAIRNGRSSARTADVTVCLRFRLQRLGGLHSSASLARVLHLGDRRFLRDGTNFVLFSLHLSHPHQGRI